MTDEGPSREGWSRRRSPATDHNACPCGDNPSVSDSLPIDLGDVVLRRVGPQDIGPICDYNALPEMAEYQRWTTTQLRDSVEAQAESDHPGLALWAVVLKAENRVVGDCQITIEDWETRQAVIGYSIHPDYWGRSYGTRAVRTLVDFGFGTMNLHRIFAGTDPRNERSVRLLERIGFRREAHFVEDFLVDGEWVDSYVYAILQKEWSEGADA